MLLFPILISNQIGPNSLSLITLLIMTSNSGEECHFAACRDIVDALIADLKNIVLPTIIEAPELFKRAVVEAHNARIASYVK